ncbi:co-chaperone GroES [Helicobacter bilis]|uniref:Co-chaperonin GroES n=1 Tax=Helicobacter bilis TaxID=37372 RepID=A0A4U8UBM8_9HELI|nr:co-chaperone GroES [Helicobacter bilis]MCI7411383.1 co-chaperone GroES [Helicobacter bilis]MDY4400269.1 co-chaperone GroES [Helicobacter bilis]TLE10026.1 co-chaperone GroES [Helicobacter bilis]TLE11837.1 co-chaperone GroES [Helicobacter bilis]
MAFKPLGKRVLVERIEEEKKTASGLIIPDNATEKPSIGVIKEVSKEVEKDDEVKKGDKVLFGKYKGNEVKIDNKDFIVLESEDILGVLK